MTFERAVMVMAMIGAGLSLLTVVALFACAVGAGFRTVVGAARRATRRTDGFGELAEAFPTRTLVELDEALERAAVDVRETASP